MSLYFIQQKKPKDDLKKRVERFKPKPEIIESVFREHREKYGLKG